MLRRDALAALHPQRRLRRERPALADVRRAVRNLAVRGEHVLRVRDALTRQAVAADLVLVHERDRRVADVRRRFEIRVAVADRRELVPDELELQVQRRHRLALLRRIRLDVVVRRRVPAAADRPLRDAAAGPTRLHRARIHAGLLIEIADDAGSLIVRQALRDEEVERGLVVRERGVGMHDQIGLIVWLGRTCTERDHRREEDPHCCARRASALPSRARTIPTSSPRAATDRLQSIVGSRGIADRKIFVVTRTRESANITSA